MTLFPTDRPEIRDETLLKLAEKSMDADLSAPALCLTIPRPELSVNFGGRMRTILTVYELTRIPDRWVPVLNKMDDVWTVSNWGKKVMQDSGVTHDVKVVPEGVDTVLFDRERWKGKVEWSGDAFGAFKFLFIGKWEKRKNIEMLIRSFQEEFHDDANVMLFLCCDNPFIKGFDPRVAAWEAGVPNDKRVVFAGGLSDENMAALYANVDAFVMPSSGEGWCLPLMEAMSSALPCVTTTWGGQSDYAKFAFKIPEIGFEDAEDGVFFHRTKGHRWAIPDKRWLRNGMRYVYENRDEATKMGRAAAKHMRERWTWKHAGLAAKKVIDGWR